VRRRLRAPRRLRATRAGWCFIAIVFGVGFAALNTGNNLLYLVLALMLAFLVLSGILSESSLRGIRVERVLPRELFARAPNRIVLRLHNDQTRNAAFAVTLEDQVEEGDERVAVGRCFALRVGAGGVADRSYVFEPAHRGDLRFAAVRASTRFPFGLFVKSRDLELPRTALVYPAIVPMAVADGRGATSDFDDHHAGVSRDGDEIAGLRDIAPGDSVSRVHWRSSLRAGRLLVGEREGLAAAEYEVELRLSADAPRPRIEERVSRAASEVVAHLEHGSRVGLRSRQRRFRPAVGFAHRADLLSFLARVEPEAVEPRAPEAMPPGREAPPTARGETARGEVAS
jgi:uncharacterized protein (DUF58 family)